MAAVAARPPRTLSIDVDVDQLAKYGSALALGSAVLATAGVLSVVAYLSAWGIPAPLIRLDPLTAALRAESVVYQFVVLAAIVFGIDAVVTRLAARRIGRVFVAATGGLALAVLAVGLAAGGFTGPLVTIVGGVGLAAIHHWRGLGPRTRTVLFAAIALGAAFITGSDSGRLIRDDPAWQTRVTLTSRVPVGGLGGGVEAGGAWQYEGLYLVFRDGEAVYVSRPGAGTAVWIVPAMHVMALGIGEAGS
jgi:hypothetical protein